MAAKANQHFVPQYYFRFFVGDTGCIDLINLTSGRLIEQASIKGQASKKYFYGDEAMENNLTTLETLFRQPLRKLKQSKTFSCLDYGDIIIALQGISFQRSRTQAARLDHKIIAQQWAEMFKEISINNCDGFSEEERIELLESVSVEPNIEALQLTLMVQAVKQGDLLGDLGMVILKNRTNRPFIFGDAPVVFQNFFQKNVSDRGVLGLRTPGLQIYFPLDSRTAIYLYDPNAYSVNANKLGQVEVRSKDDVDKLNRLQIHNAASAVYLPSKDSADYVLQLWRESKRNQFITKGRLEEYSVKHDGETRHILLNYEAQLSYVPDFGFSPCSRLAISGDLLIDRESWDGRRYIADPRPWHMPELRQRFK